MVKVWMMIGFVAAVVVNHSLAFVADRSVVLAWDTPPVLESEQKTSMDRVFDGKMQVTGMDKVLQSSDAEKSVKRDEDSLGEDASRAKRSEETSVTTPDDRNITSRATTTVTGTKEMQRSSITVEDNATDKESNLPRNVVLLLVDTSDQDKDSAWKDLKTQHDFPVQGFLQSCYREEDSSVKSDGLEENRTRIVRKDEECRCEHFLRANIGGLLTWARHARAMTTGTVSATNFTFPSTIGYESSVGITREFEEGGAQNNFKRDARDGRLDSWRLIDLDRQPGFALTASPAAKVDGKFLKSLEMLVGGCDAYSINYLLSAGLGNSDEMWDIFDAFSRIRLAFFRTLRDVLTGKVSGTKEEFSSRRSTLSQPTSSDLRELLGDTLKGLKSVSNDQGYLLVAAGSGKDASSAVELLNRETSAKDTLLVVAGNCQTDKTLAPFYASGPGAKSLRESRSVWDLPGTIRNTLSSSGCRGFGCRIRRHDAQMPDSMTPTIEEVDNSHSGKVKDDKVEVRREEEQDETTDMNGKNGASGVTLGSARTLLGFTTTIFATIVLEP